MRAWTRLRTRLQRPAPGAAPAGRDLLKWVAAACALVATASAEYDLARAIGMHEAVALAVPGALDAYVVRALRAHREVFTAVLAMVAVNAASHLVTASVLRVDWLLITAVSAIAPLVLWRVHALGHTSTRARDDEHTEHDRAPDNPEPPGTREHPHVAVLDAACTLCLHEHTGPCKHFAGTVGACTCGHAASTVDLDVPDWVNPPSTPPVPVHAPYADHVDIGTPGVLDLSAARARREHTGTGRCPECSHLEHANDICNLVQCPCDGGGALASTERTADDWNLEHVSTGVLEPDDVEHMERARELFHTIQGLPPFRALKEGTPGMGTARARRLRAALEVEHAASTPSTDGART